MIYTNASNYTYETSNKLVDYNNLNNQPWVNNGIHIYNNNNGNVGINKTNPNFKLDVNGIIHSSTITINVGNVNTTGNNFHYNY